MYVPKHAGLFSRLRGVGIGNHIYKTELCPHHQAFSCCAIHVRPKHGSSAGWGGSAVANAFRNRLLSSSSSPCLTCSIYVVWNCLETGPILGEYFCLRKGDVASMWHILVRLVDGCQVDMRELCHQCGHLQPDFGEWVGVAPSMSLKMTFFFAIFFLRSGNLPLCLAPENGPHQVPRKRTFSWVSHRKLDTWWGPFSGGEPKWKIGTALVSLHFFSQHQAAFLGT